MGFKETLERLTFNNVCRRLNIRVRPTDDTVSHRRTAGRFSGSIAAVSTGALRGTLTRSTLQRGWQKPGQVFISIVTPDGVELAIKAESETQARRFVAQYNTRSRAHGQE